MKTYQDAERLVRVIEVYDQAKASMDKVLQSDASNVRKVEQLKEIVLRADKEVENILHAQKKDSSVEEHSPPLFFNSVKQMMQFDLLTSSAI